MKTLVITLALLAMSWESRAGTAYGSLNNFDVVNDTGDKCHGFEIELEDLRSVDITYTYDWNHYGAPRITQDDSIPGHPRVKVRYESKRNPDGSYASFTNPQDPLNPLAPTDGHAFTDPSVNLGGEHFGMGYYGSPTVVRYHWLVDDPASPGTLILGPAVQVATPQFTYNPPVAPPVNPGDPPAAPARMVAIIAPPEAEEVPEGRFGVPVWVKVFKTVQPSGRKVKIEDLVTDDPRNPNDKDWAGDEQAETEIEWTLFQKRPASNPEKGELEASDDLKNGDEIVTRRYEFYAYAGETNPEDGEAKCSNPKKCPDAIGAYIGAQMAGFGEEMELAFIEHLQSGTLDVPYTERTLLAGGAAPYDVKVTAGRLPIGLSIDPATSILSGTPTEAGDYVVTLEGTDAAGGKVGHTYNLRIETEVIPESTLSITLDDGRLRLWLRGTPLTPWQLEFSRSPEGPWEPVGDAFSLPVGGEAEFTGPPAESAAYFRAVVVQ